MTDRHDQQPREASLSPDAAGAVDRWLEDRAAGRKPTSSPVARLLETLGAPVPGQEPADTTLADATVLRIAREGALAACDAEPSLGRLSAEAVDAWAIAGYSAAHTAGDLRPRAERLDGLSSLVTETPTPLASSDLVARTMARVDQAAAHEPLPFRPSRFRMTDLLSAAAVLLIAASVIWPMMASARASSERAMCEANLGSTGQAISAYTTSNDGYLPIATAGFAQPIAFQRRSPSPASQPWWDVGSRERPANSAHLFVLVRESYAEIDDLACPGNPMAPRRLTDPSAVDWSSIDEISYSYQFAHDAPIWLRSNRGVLLADRSPVVQRAVRGEAANPFANSDNHERRGQHTLRVDGSAAWLTSPITETGDNIWLPRHIERMIDRAIRELHLQGLEQPEGPDDAFVGP
ncbi:MAG: hypothetical protein AAGK04_10820 [Planctomycetota bacterium]